MTKSTLFYIMRRYFQAPWSIKEVATVLAIAVLFTCMTIIGLQLLEFNGIIKPAEYRIQILIIGFFIQALAALIPITIITLKKYKKLSAKQFGLEHIGVWPSIRLILGGFLIFLGITSIISIFIVYTNIKIPGYQIQEKILPFFADSNMNIVLVGILAIGLAPIFEEIFFRGFILRSLVNKIGVYKGSIISAAIFAAFHMQWGSIIPIFVMGLIINGIVIRGRSIWPAIGFHVINNGIAIVVEILLVKDIISLDTIT